MAQPSGTLESEILHAVWRLGRCTVRDVHDAVGVPRGVVYTTTAKVLERLEQKGLLAKERKGLTLVYRAGKRPKIVERARVKGLLERIVGSNPEPAVANLVDALEAIDPALLDAFAKEIADRTRRRR